MDNPYILLFSQSDTATIDWSFLHSMPYGLTFARAGSATRFDGSGVMQSAAVNEPRFDYDPFTHQPRGVLLEPARQNVFLNSETPATQNITVSATSYTLSFYGAGSVTLSGVKTGVLNGSGAYPHRANLVFTPSAGTLTLTVSGDVQKAQLEIGALTSYIPTGVSPVTRAQDNLYATTPPWLNNTQGTLLIEYSPESFASLYRSMCLSDGTASNIIESYLVNTTQYMQAAINVAGSAKYDNGTQAFSTGDTVKEAIAYKDGANRHVLNGAITAASDFNTSALPSGLNRLSLGNRADMLRPLHGYIKRFRYWSDALPDADLQIVTL